MKFWFYDKVSGKALPPEDEYFIRNDGTVWGDSGEVCESQCAVMGFDDFIIEYPNIGFDVKGW